MKEQRRDSQKALIIYKDDNDEIKKVYSNYQIDGDLIMFVTASNKITINISRLIKIKEGKNNENK